MDFPGRVLATLIAIILITIFPLQYLAQTYNENVDTYIDDDTKQLVNDIRDKGYLDKSMYEEFIGDLDNTRELYDIEIADIQPVSGQVEGLTTYDAKEMASKRDGFIEASYHTVDKKLLKISQTKVTEDEDLQLPTDKDEIHSLATHTHADTCYAGHRHASSSCIASGDMTRQVYVTANYYNGGQYVRGVSVKCASCNSVLYSTGYTYDLGAGYYYYTYDAVGNMIYNRVSLNHNWDANTIQFAHNSVRTIFDYCTNAGLWANTSWSSYDELSYTSRPFYWNLGNYPVYSGTGASYTAVPIPFLGCLQCGKSNFGRNFSCGLAQDENPICNQVITALTPTNPSQTIKKGESIIITATATYLDGHTGIVICSSDFNPNLDGTQFVTLSYSALVNNAKYYATMNRGIYVTVISKVLTSISVSPTAQVVFRINPPSFTVYANYSDGTSTVLTSDKYLVSAYNPYVLGKQTLTISYTEGGITKTTPFDLFIDDLMSITVTPTVLTVDRYTQPNALPITIMANSMYIPSWNVTGSHTISGYSPDTIGTQTVMVSYKYYDTTRTATIQVDVTGLHKTCPICGTIYELKDDDTDPGCPFCKNTIVSIYVTPEYIEVKQGQPLPATVLAKYQDGSTQVIDSWTSNYDPERLGVQYVSVEYGGFTDEVSVFVMEATVICPVCKTEYATSKAKCPVCSQTVISISATPASITVRRYDNIDLAVNATYADKSVRQVTDWSIDRTTSVEGVFIATVSYENVSTTINMTVIPATTIGCSICGLTYNKGDHPNGCPVCSKKLTGIEAYLVTGSKLVQRGTIPSIAIVLIFKDEHREVALDNYTISYYEPYTLREQTITVSYGGFTTTLDLEVVNTLNSITCPNGHVYYQNEDNSDFGCPYCKITDEVGEEVYFFDITYTAEILEALYREGVYYFKENHYVTVEVSKKQKSLRTKIQRTFFGTAILGRKKRITYGGRVLS